MLVSQSKEINKPANIIKHLNASVISLTETVTSLQSRVTSHPSAPEQSGNAETIVTAINKSTFSKIVSLMQLSTGLMNVQRVPQGMNTRGLISVMLHFLSNTLFPVCCRRRGTRRLPPTAGELRTLPQLRLYHLRDYFVAVS